MKSNACRKSAQFKQTEITQLDKDIGQKRMTENEYRTRFFFIVNLLLQFSILVIFFAEVLQLGYCRMAINYGLRDPVTNADHIKV